jgi:NAD(P)H dehydrogenase (quinone)
MTNTCGRIFLIAGATGKTGRHTVRLLLQRGYCVRAFVHRADTRSTQLAEQGAEIVVGDLLDLGSVRAAARAVDGAYFTYPIREDLTQISARPEAGSNAARQHWLAERWLDWRHSW